jgi:hypothetical protein
VERFNLRNLSELEDREQHQIKISNRFADFESLNCSEDINRAWKNTKENTKTSAKKSLGLYESKKHLLWFDEDCLKFLD